MDLLLLSRDPSLIHLLYSQEKSLWKIRTDLQSAACPLIAAPSRGHSEPVSLFSCCPTVFFFLTHWVNSLLRIFLAGKHRHTATWEVQRQVRHML